MTVWKYFKFANQHAVRKSAAVALTASAPAPNSGFVFVDNSQGASAAIAELARSLDFALDLINLEQELDDQRRQQLERLTKKAAEYSNSRLALGVGSSWTCSTVEANIISGAYVCSAAAYDSEVTPESQGWTFRSLRYVSSSRFGTTKATGFWTMEPQKDLMSSDSILVIAVRGTHGSVDHMVNLNERMEDASRDDFINFDIGESIQPLKFHAGFFHSAKALSTIVSNEIRKHISDGKIKHVLFTGHSAGGATASILYTHFVSKASSEFASLTFSLITFGAAPVASFDITPILRQRSKKNSEPGLMVAIVNEYDIVPRVDGPYIRSLVDLYRDIYNLPPISDNPPSKQEVQYRPSIDVPDAGGHYQTSYSGKKNNQTQPEWSLPAPRYNLVGDIILLKMRLFPEVGAAVGAGTIAQPKFDAVKMSHRDFQRLIFCSTDVHKRTCYQERIEMIRKRAHDDEFTAEKKELRWIPTVSTMVDSIEGSLNSGAEDDLDDDWVKYVARAIH